MPIYNSDIAHIFGQIADLLEIQGNNQFRVRAYRNAVDIVSGLGRNISEMVERDEDLTQISGIGKELALKITEIVQSGSLQYLERLKGELPISLLDLLKIGGLGAKRVKVLYEKLDITTIADALEAAQRGQIQKLPGFGKKTEENIITEITHLKNREKRFRIDRVEERVQSIIAYMKECAGIMNILITGSYRRRKESVGDIDILVTGETPDSVMDHFIAFDEINRVLAKGPTKSSVVLNNELQVDLRVLEPKSFGAALHYFTGSQAHNIAMRKRAMEYGLKLNEYGLFKDEKWIAGTTEEEIFSTLGLPFIEPELRENRGEIQAALSGTLPKLITMQDIRGELHTHSLYSDGNFSISDMASAARERGYDYMAVTDHSKSLTIAKGINEKQLMSQIHEIDRLNAQFDDFTILKGIEVDILGDGSLDLDDEILKELDIVICSIHTRFNLPGEKQTERVLRAMDNRYATMIAHPTGRYMTMRPAYDIDLEKIISAAAQKGVFMELNANPERLDLDDIHCKLAKEKGVKIGISTDSHSLKMFDHVYYGIGQARRGWLEKEDVINTRSLPELRKLLKQRR